MRMLIAGLGLVGAVLLSGCELPEIPDGLARELQAYNNAQVHPAPVYRPPVRTNTDYVPPARPAGGSRTTTASSTSSSSLTERRLKREAARKAAQAEEDRIQAELQQKLKASAEARALAQKTADAERDAKDLALKTEQVRASNARQHTAIAKADRAKATVAAEAAAKEKARKDSENEAERERLAQMQLAKDAETKRLADARIASDQAEQQRVALERQRAQAAAKAEADRRSVWNEGIVACPVADKTKLFGESTCYGPFQNVLANAAKPNLSDLANACGAAIGGVHELGVFGQYRVWGCGFGINPKFSRRSPHVEVSDQIGVLVPGRQRFSCHPDKTEVCRTL